MAYDSDDTFDDFEGKVHEKKKSTLFSKEEDSEEDYVKHKFKEEQGALKDQYRKEMASIHAKKTKQAIREGKMPPHHKFKIERMAYIAAIVILFLYIIVDLSVFHGSSDPVLEEGMIDESSDTATTDEEQKKETDSEAEEVEEIEEDPEEDTTVEEKKKDKQTFSGRVDFIINNIKTEVVGDDRGYILEVSFTIQNDKSTTLTPIVTVYAYDSELEDTWIARPRGTYTLSSGIAPGKYEEAKIKLSPKTFINLHLDKTVRIELNSTEDGFIKATSKKIEIK